MITMLVFDIIILSFIAYGVMAFLHYEEREKGEKQSLNDTASHLQKWEMGIDKR